jgi:hypothetical protein
MPLMSDEEKYANVLAKGLDRLGVNHHLIVANFMTRNSGIQANLFELILAFLNKYASLYANGDVTEGERMYSVCEMSYRMVCALDGPQYWETGTGRHCSPEE